MFRIFFFFDLVLSFYFLKWNRYFSACENLPSSSVILQTTSQFFLKFCTTLHCHETSLLCTFLVQTLQGQIQRFWKGVVLYVGHHGWPKKEILNLRWSKNIKITLETISFWQNISISIFKFSLFLYAIKACQWNLINFSKFGKRFDKERKKKHLCNSQRDKKNREKLDFSVYNRFF